ncbi:hypothetical protein SMMN14_03072 [Sphaerulina musiva]
MAVISDTNSSRGVFVVGGDATSITLSLVAIPAIVVFIWQRYQDTQAKHLSVASVSCFACYISSLAFIVAVTMLLHIRAPVTRTLCDATLMVCIVLHKFAKGSEFLFLIERIYVISWTTKPRYRSTQYILGIILIMLPYTAFTAATIFFRYTIDKGHDLCVIGIRLPATIALLSLEVSAQVYFTIRFSWPLFTVHRNIKGLVQPLRQLIVRTCIGSAVSSLANIASSISVAVWVGQGPAWLCCLVCKASVFISACALHWITRPIQSVSQHGSGPHAFGDLAVGFSGSPGAAPHALSFSQPPSSKKDLAAMDGQSISKYPSSVTEEMGERSPQKLAMSKLESLA